MSIQQIPLAPPIYITPDHSALDALQLLIEFKFNHLPVCLDSKFLGLLSINDLLLQAIPTSAKINGGLTDLSFAGDALGLLSSMLDQLKLLNAGSIMHSPAVTLPENCPLLEAALLLSKNDSPLPVLNEQGKLLGMLSRRVLLSYLLQNTSSK